MEFPALSSLWDYNNPQKTEVTFRELLPKAKESNQTEYYAELLTQLARTQSLQRKFDEAHQILDSALEVITDEMVVPQIRYHLERGRTYNSSGNKPVASEQFLLAFNLSLDNNQDYYAVDAAHMLGISEQAEQSLAWNVKAIELAEKSTDSRTNGWLGPLYNNTGWTFHDMGNHHKALDLFEKSLDWRKDRNDPKGKFIARWTIGRAYRSLNRIEDALNTQQELLAEIEEGNAEPDGFVYEELAECLLIQGNEEGAKRYFAQAYELLSNLQWLQATEPERVERLKKMGE